MTNPFEVVNRIKSIKLLKTNYLSSENVKARYVYRIIELIVIVLIDFVLFLFFSIERGRYSHP